MILRIFNWIILAILFAAFFVVWAFVFIALVLILLSIVGIIGSSYG